MRRLPYDAEKTTVELAPATIRAIRAVQDSRVDIGSSKLPTAGELIDEAIREHFWASWIAANRR